MTDIVISDLTNSADLPIGTGVFDVLMASVQKHIEEQFESGRITGADYATVYLGSVQAVLQQSVAFLMQEQEAGYKGDIAKHSVDTQIAQTAKIYADIALVDQKQLTELVKTSNATGGEAKFKQDLIAAQTLGFENDSKLKLLKSMLEGYAVNLSIAGVADVPETVLEQSIDQLSQNILDSFSESPTAQARVVIQDSVQAPATEVAVPG